MCARTFFLIVFVLLVIDVNHCKHLVSAREASSSRRVLQAGPGQNAQDILRRLQSTPLALQGSTAEQLLEAGFKYETPGRNWKRLAQKFATPGSNVTIAAFGGSVTAGYYAGSQNTSWVNELTKWMKTVFPEVNFVIVNVARGATDVTAAAICWYQYIPTDTDMVFIEYSFNGCNMLQCISISQAKVADYETLLRQVIVRAPQAAIMSFAIYSFIYFDNVAMPFYNTGEDVHSAIARRYSVPMMSLRDTLYDLMYSDEATQRAALGLTRKDILKDEIHPTGTGHRLYGQGLMAYAVRKMLIREYNSPDIFSADLPTVRMPRVLSPRAAMSADVETFCAEGLPFRAYVSSSRGWRWVDDSRKSSDVAGGYACTSVNCRKYGFVSRTPGNFLEIRFDSTAVRPTSPDQNSTRLVIFHLKTPDVKQAMGNARVTCESGCTCNPLDISGRNTDFSSALSTAATKITGHPQCVIRVTILPETQSGGYYFKVSGIAVVPYAPRPPQLTPVDDLLLQQSAV